MVGDMFCQGQATGFSVMAPSHIRGWRHQISGGGLTQNMALMGSIFIFEQNEPYHDDPDEILVYLEITYVYHKLPL